MHSQMQLQSHFATCKSNGQRNLIFANVAPTANANVVPPRAQSIRLISEFCATFIANKIDMLLRPVVVLCETCSVLDQEPDRQ